MTIQDYIKDKLYNSGMFPEQAEEVLTMVKADPANAAMQGRWTDSTADYPPAILALSWMAAKRSALQWIDKNFPKAWYRPMFTEDKVRR